tara:strand:+ start:146 stop:463 length:318 start_codon:yes stop_codon:yes gene_type:complete
MIKLKQSVITAITIYLHENKEKLEPLNIRELRIHLSEHFGFSFDSSRARTYRDPMEDHGWAPCKSNRQVAPTVTSKSDTDQLISMIASLEMRIVKLEARQFNLNS